MSVVSLLKPTGPNGFGYGSTAEQVTAGLDLKGKTFLLTGCNSGIGQETLRVLRLRGAQVLGTGRSQARAEEACAPLAATALACDLAEPSSVLQCVEAVKQLALALDGVICNAGIMCPSSLQLSHGFESQFFTNHIGHFLLVTRLLPLLKPDARIVVVSSNAHRRAPAAGIEFDNLDGAKGYEPWAAYGQSKLANLLFVRHLATRLRGTSQTVNALHPGVIATNLMRSMSWDQRLAMSIASPLLFKSIAEGAATQCYLAANPGVQGVSGEYFSDCNPKQSRPLGLDLVLAERLWQVSEAIVEKVA